MGSEGSRNGHSFGAGGDQGPAALRRGTQCRRVARAATARLGDSSSCEMKEPRAGEASRLQWGSWAFLTGVDQPTGQTGMVPDTVQAEGCFSSSSTNWIN